MRELGGKTITIKLSRILSIIVSASLIALSLQMFYWTTQPSKVLVINNEPVPVEPPEVKDGGKVFLTIDFCQDISATAVTEVHLVGEQGAKVRVNWPPGRVEKQCSVYPDIPVPIPGQTPTDIYYVEFKSCYDINPLKNNQCTIFKSKSFKVINPKLQPDDAQVEERAE